MQYYVDRLCSLGLSRADAALIVRDFMKELDVKGLRAYIDELEQIRGRLIKTETVNRALDEIGLERI